jgi:hypothetical protein
MAFSPVLWLENDKTMWHHLTAKRGVTALELLPVLTNEIASRVTSFWQALQFLPCQDQKLATSQTTTRHTKGFPLQPQLGVSSGGKDPLASD